MTKVGDRLRSTVFVAVAFSAFALPAATRTWTGGGDGLRWSDPLNWEGGACPTNGMKDAVSLSNPGTTPVISNDLGTVSIGKILVTSGNVALVGDPIVFDGSEETVIDANQSLTLSIANDLTLANTRDMRFELPSSFTLTGSLTSEEPTTAKTLRCYARANGRVGTIDGDVVLPGWNIQNIYKTNGTLQFNGRLTCKALLSSGGSIGGDTGTFLLNSPEPAFTEVRAGFSSVKCLRTGAIAPEAVISFGGYSQDNYSIMDLNGKDQTCDRVRSNPKSEAYWCAGNYIRSTGAARLTMNGTDDALTCCQVEGAVSLVWNPAEAHTQVFSNRVNTTTGDLIVSNGTFAVSGAASFAQVRRIIVADGATFDLSSTRSESLVAVREISVGQNANFTIGDGVPSPFASGILDLSLDESANFRIGANVAVTLKSLTVGGIAAEGGDYTGGTIPQFTGTGTLSVPEIETPTKDATWTAGATPDESVQNEDNWSAGFMSTDLRSHGLRPLFASAGSRAVIDQDVDFKGVRFGLPASDTNRSFTLASEGGATMKLRSLGLAAEARDGTNRNAYVIDVPIVLKEVEQTWSLADSLATFRFLRPLSGASTVMKTGASRMELHAPNDAFTGAFSAAGGTLDVYAPSNGLGSALATAADLDARAATYTFHGVHESRAIVIREDNTSLDTTKCVFADGTTNVLSGTLTFLKSDGGSALGGFRVGPGAVVVTEKAVTSGGVSGLTGGGTWICRGAFKYNQLMQGDGTLRLETKTLNRGDGEQPTIRIYGVTSRFVCTLTNQFNSSYNQINLDDGIFDLNGCPQRIGGLSVNDAEVLGGVVYSESPATLTVVGYGCSDAQMILTKPDFTGAVSFNGPEVAAKTFTVNRAVSSTGSITVPGGTFAFTALGSWKNGSRVGVKGTGKLKIAASKTLNSKVLVSVTDAGTVDLAAGVRQKCAELWIGGQKCADGVWGSSASGAPNVSSSLPGTGVFEVGVGGFMLMVL